MVKIQQNIAIPIDKKHNAKWGQTKYPFADMQVGDSFAVDSDRRHSVSTLAKKYGDRNEKRFTVRKDQGGQLRCWRL